MNPTYRKFLTTAAAGCFALGLAACGGGGETTTADEAEAATTDVVEAADAAVEDVAADAGAAVEEAAADAAEAGAVVEETVADAGAAVETAVADAGATVENAVADAADEGAQVIQAAEDQAAEVVEVAEEAGSALALAGDAANGQRVFAQCRSCHAVQEGRNLVGPSLYGVVGRMAGTVEGFRYSNANKESGVVWTEQNLFEYLENPRAYIPGTTMAFPGLRKEQDRADVIAYLKDASS